MASFVKCSGWKHDLSCLDDKFKNCNCDFYCPKDSQHCHLFPLTCLHYIKTSRKISNPKWLLIRCWKKHSFDYRNKMQFVRSNPPNQLRVSDFHRKGRQTKNCAVCSFLFFYARSFSSEVIVGDYNKSNSAVHLSHTLSHTSTPAWQQACHPLGFSFYHVKRCLPAGRQIKGRRKGKGGGGGEGGGRRRKEGTMQGRFCGFNWERQQQEWQ